VDFNQTLERSSFSCTALLCPVGQGNLPLGLKYCEPLACLPPANSNLWAKSRTRFRRRFSRTFTVFPRILASCRLAAISNSYSLMPTKKRGGKAPLVRYVPYLPPYTMSAAARMSPPPTIVQRSTISPSAKAAIREATMGSVRPYMLAFVASMRFSAAR